MTKKTTKHRKATNRPQVATFQQTSPPMPVLRFSPAAWAKLLFFRDAGETEIGGFGVTPADDLLYVGEFITVRQGASFTNVAFDDEAVAGFFEDQVEAGHSPEQFARIWLHTHPGESAEPSLTDERTFARVFGGCEWAVMFILAKSGSTVARLRFNVGPCGEISIPVVTDFGLPFVGSDHGEWEAEYRANVTIAHTRHVRRRGPDLEDELDLRDLCVSDEWIGEFEDMEPSERRFVLDELAARPHLWTESEEIDEC